MTRYGHDLRFGAFVTPTSREPHEPVRLALVAESAGLDLVSFQDHPYQPNFLDTWTLMSFVAARTDRIRIAPNVLNVPLRPPAVVARAAASLDLLSGGRFDLGLGAGFVRDAVVAMGGAPLSAAESVDALEEAIAIVRGTWDVGDQDRFVVAGRHHRVDGAKRGPAPDHAIELWLGAYKPRMLRLVGRAGDGWLPGVPYLESTASIAHGNAVIDEAAIAAGRSPEDVRRMLNLGGRSGFPRGDAADWAEQLAALTLADGVSTYLTMSDDERDIARFGQEVAPEVRRLVAAEGGAGGAR